MPLPVLLGRLDPKIPSSVSVSVIFERTLYRVVFLGGGRNLNRYSKAPRNGRANPAVAGIRLRIASAGRAQ